MQTFDHVDDAYLKILTHVAGFPEFRSAPRGKKVSECLHYGFTILNPSSKSIKTRSEDRNKVMETYYAAEKLLYDQGARTMEEFATKGSKFWRALGNPDGTINSAYGWLIFYDKSCGNPEFESPTTMRTPWDWAKNSLIADVHTRQAILKFHKREHLWVGNKDQTCTFSANFHIRENKLHFTVHMRSQDLVKGFPYDIPWFCSLQERMCQELQSQYPNLDLGKYTHFVDSLHIYDSDLPKVAEMTGIELRKFDE